MSKKDRIAEISSDEELIDEQIKELVNNIIDKLCLSKNKSEIVSYNSEKKSFGTLNSLKREEITSRTHRPTKKRKKRRQELNSCSTEVVCSPQNEMPNNLSKYVENKIHVYSENETFLKGTSLKEETRSDSNQTTASNKIQNVNSKSLEIILPPQYRIKYNKNENDNIPQNECCIHKLKKILLKNGDNNDNNENNSIGDSSKPNDHTSKKKDIIKNKTQESEKNIIEILPPQYRLKNTNIDNRKQTCSYLINLKCLTIKVKYHKTIDLVEPYEKDKTHKIPNKHRSKRKSKKCDGDDEKLQKNNNLYECPAEEMTNDTLTSCVLSIKVHDENGISKTVLEKTLSGYTKPPKLQFKVYGGSQNVKVIGKNCIQTYVTSTTLASDNTKQEIHSQSGIASERQNSSSSASTHNFSTEFITYTECQQIIRRLKQKKRSGKKRRFLENEKLSIDLTDYYAKAFNKNDYCEKKTISSNHNLDDGKQFQIELHSKINVDSSKVSVNETDELLNKQNSAGNIIFQLEKNSSQNSIVSTPQKKCESENDSVESLPRAQSFTPSVVQYILYQPVENVIYTNDIITDCPVLNLKKSHDSLLDMTCEMNSKKNTEIFEPIKIFADQEESKASDQLNIIHASPQADENYNLTDFIDLNDKIQSCISEWDICEYFNQFLLTKPLEKKSDCNKTDDENSNIDQWHQYADAFKSRNAFAGKIDVLETILESDVTNSNSTTSAEPAVSAVNIINKHAEICQQSKSVNIIYEPEQSYLKNCKEKSDVKICSVSKDSLNKEQLSNAIEEKNSETTTDEKIDPGKKLTISKDQDCFTKTITLYDSNKLNFSPLAVVISNQTMPNSKTNKSQNSASIAVKITLSNKNANDDTFNAQTNEGDSRRKANLICNDSIKSIKVIVSKTRGFGEPGQNISVENMESLLCNKDSSKHQNTKSELNSDSKRHNERKNLRFFIPVHLKQSQDKSEKNNETLENFNKVGKHKSKNQTHSFITMDKQNPGKSCDLKVAFQSNKKVEENENENHCKTLSQRKETSIENKLLGGNSADLNKNEKLRELTFIVEERPGNELNDERNCEKKSNIGHTSSDVKISIKGKITNDSYQSVTSKNNELQQTKYLNVQKSTDIKESDVYINKNRSIFSNEDKLKSSRNIIFQENAMMDITRLWLNHGKAKSDLTASKNFIIESIERNQFSDIGNNEIELKRNIFKTANDSFLSGRNNTFIINDQDKCLKWRNAHKEIIVLYPYEIKNILNFDLVGKFLPKFSIKRNSLEKKRTHFQIAEEEQPSTSQSIKKKLFDHKIEKGHSSKIPILKTLESHNPHNSKDVDHDRIKFNLKHKKRARSDKTGKAVSAKTAAPEKNAVRKIEIIREVINLGSSTSSNESLYNQKIKEKAKPNREKNKIKFDSYKKLVPNILAKQTTKKDNDSSLNESFYTPKIKQKSKTCCDKPSCESNKYSFGICGHPELINNTEEKHSKASPKLEKLKSQIKKIHLNTKAAQENDNNNNLEPLDNKLTEKHIKTERSPKLPPDKESKFPADAISKKENAKVQDKTEESPKLLPDKESKFPADAISKKENAKVQDKTERSPKLPPDKESKFPADAISKKENAKVQDKTEESPKLLPDKESKFPADAISKKENAKVQDKTEESPKLLPDKESKFPADAISKKENAKVQDKTEKSPKLPPNKESKFPADAISKKENAKVQDKTEKSPKLPPDKESKFPADALSKKENAKVQDKTEESPKLPPDKESKFPADAIFKKENAKVQDMSDEKSANQKIEHNEIENQIVKNSKKINSTDDNTEIKNEEDFFVPKNKSNNKAHEHPPTSNKLVQNEKTDRQILDIAGELKCENPDEVKEIIRRESKISEQKFSFKTDLNKMNDKEKFEELLNVINKVETDENTNIKMQLSRSGVTVVKTEYPNMPDLSLSDEEEQKVQMLNALPLDAEKKGYWETRQSSENLENEKRRKKSSFSKILHVLTGNRNKKNNNGNYIVSPRLTVNSSTLSVFQEPTIIKDNKYKKSKRVTTSHLQADLPDNIYPQEIGNCFRRGFRADNLALSGRKCFELNESEKEKLRQPIFPQPRTSQIIFSERQTPLDFLIDLGFSVDEASTAVKNEDVETRLYAAIAEARVWINQISSTQGSLLYLLAYKTDQKVMRYFLQFVEGIINKRITNAVKLDGFLRLLIKLEEGDLTMTTIFSSDKFNIEEDEGKLVRKQLKKLFIHIYKIADKQANLIRKPLTNESVNLLRTIIEKYKAGIHPHLNILAEYIGQRCITIDVQLEAAMIYLSRLNANEVNLEHMEKYCAIPPRKILTGAKK